MLDPKLVETIRKLLAAGATQRSVQRITGVSRGRIIVIANGEYPDCGVDPAGDGIDTPPSPVGPCLFMQPVRCCEPSLRRRCVARSPFTRRPHPVTRRLSQATLVSLRIVSAAILIKVQRIIPSATGRRRFAWHLAGTISRGSARPIMSCSTAVCLKANWGGMGARRGVLLPWPVVICLL